MWLTSVLSGVDHISLAARVYVVSARRHEGDWNSLKTDFVYKMSVAR